MDSCVGEESRGPITKERSCWAVTVISCQFAKKLAASPLGSLASGPNTKRNTKWPPPSFRQVTAGEIPFSECSTTRDSEPIEGPPFVQSPTRLIETSSLKVCMVRLVYD